MNSFIKWIGGKKILREKIISEFPEEFERYIEVFGGAGWVLFARDKHSKFEVFNDKNSDLINLYRCIKYHREELQRELTFIVHSRELFKDFKSQMQASGMTDIQRAARYFVIIRSSFGADLRSFATGVSNIRDQINGFINVQERLKKVIIENRDFADIIKTYDREKSLFYLDPPYYNAEQYYDTEFSNEDHIRLYQTLEGIKGKFVLSYNADPFIEDLYKDYNIIRVQRFNNLSSNNNSYKEVIIKNF